MSVILTEHIRQTLDERITGFVGLAVHGVSPAIRVAQSGRSPPRSLGTVSPTLTELTRALGKFRTTAADPHRGAGAPFA